MRKYPVLISVIIFAICIFGCAKKEVAIEELPQPVSMETLTTMDAALQTTPEAKVSNVSPSASVPAKELDLPPAGPYKPSAVEIQTALKNAGFYNAEIDGKIGPMTKKSIVEFQKTNGLQADGKVGPKTWEVLSPYLNPPAEAKPKKR